MAYFGSSAILGTFGESFHGFSEEARTRGFPSPSFGGFGFVVFYYSFIRPVGGIFLIVNLMIGGQECPLGVISGPSNQF